MTTLQASRFERGCCLPLATSTLYLFELYLTLYNQMYSHSGPSCNRGLIIILVLVMQNLTLVISIAKKQAGTPGKNTPSISWFWRHRACMDGIWSHYVTDVQIMRVSSCLDNQAYHSRPLFSISYQWLFDVYDSLLLTYFQHLVTWKYALFYWHIYPYYHQFMSIVDVSHLIWLYVWHYWIKTHLSMQCGPIPLVIQRFSPVLWSGKIALSSARS